MYLATFSSLRGIGCSTIIHLVPHVYKANYPICHNFQVYLLVGGRLDQRSINRRCHGTIAFGH